MRLIFVVTTILIVALTWNSITGEILPKSNPYQKPPCSWTNEILNGPTGILTLCCAPIDKKYGFVTINMTFRSYHTADKYRVYGTGLYFGGVYTCDGLNADKIYYRGTKWHEYCAIIPSPALIAPAPWQATFKVECMNIISGLPCGIIVTQGSITGGQGCGLP